MSKLRIKYFVLNPKSKFFNDKYAIASRQAIIAYARSIREEDDEFARELLNWIDVEVFYEFKLNKEKK